MKKLIFTSLLFLPLFANAGTTCYGKVSSVMERDDQCNGNIAYNTGSVWFCSISKSSGSIVLAAYTAGKSIQTTFKDSVSNEASCEKLTTNFLTPWSIRTTD